MSKIICLSFFLLCSISSAIALSCYSCDSSKNIACDYGWFSFTLDVEDCSSGLGGFLPSACTKIVAKDKRGREYIYRGCGVNTGPINGCQAAAKILKFAAVDGDLDDLNCYTCNTDKCNSATNIQSFTIVGVLTACLLYLL